MANVLKIVLAVMLGLAAPSTAAAQPPPCAAGVEEIGGIWYDADGLIVHKPSAEHPCGDGGDTAQREGWYWLGVWIRQNTPGLQPWPHARRLSFDEVLRLMEPQQDGVFYRHPKLAPWNNPHDKKFGLSRDQMVPLVAAMGVWGKQAELRRLWDALPEDALGKHTFNGNWRNLLGQDGVSCTDIKRRGCDATRSCPLNTDNRDCSLKVDNRSCPLQEDTRSCNRCLISNPFGGCILYGNDPACEAAKAAQNAIYKVNKDACEAAKAAQNLIYAGDKVACEAAKATQNAIYKADKDACEITKASEKAACEIQKTIDLNVCRLSNVHSGDFVGPATENLFSRAMNETPSHSLGDAELLANALLRVGLATDRDDTGDDLNLIIMLIMAELRSSTAVSRSATAAYSTYRPYSYGSYLDAYRAAYGTNNGADMTARIDAGIRSGWPADAPPAQGAVHWYHRVETGGNAGLADLYDPIIDRYIYGDLNALFSTLAAGTSSPVMDGLSPSAGSVEGGTVVTVTGRNFVAGATVMVGGIPATDVVVIDGSTLRATTPKGPTGPAAFSVTLPWPQGGSTTAPGAFVYLDDANIPPERPTGTSVTVVGNLVSLGWSSAQRAVSYVLEAGSSPGAHDLLVHDLGAGTAFQTQAPPGRYYVRVRAANQAGLSAPSDEMTVDVGGPSIPPPPANLSATVTGTDVTLQWTASSGATSYLLDAGTAAGLADVFSGDLGGNTSVTTAAPPGTYFVRVRARNASGLSMSSNEIVLTTSCQRPAAPAALSYIRRNGLVLLSWTGTQGSSYILEAGAGPGLTNVFVGDVGSNLTLEAAAPPGVYHVRVRAKNACGTSLTSNEIEVHVP